MNGFNGRRSKATNDDSEISAPLAIGTFRLMAVFQAFFDAAGDPSDSNVHVCGIAGWIAPEAKWRRLNRAWRDICDRESVSGLHMREFAHSRGQYATWRGDEERRSRFLGDLVTIIRMHTNREFSQQMFLDGYRAVDNQFEFHERIGHPYAICAVMCINAVQDWMAKTHPKADIMFIFEKGDSHQGDVLEMLRRDNRSLDPNALLFIEKRRRVDGNLECLPPLECADFLVYEQQKTITDLYVNRKHGKARKSIWALTGEGAHFKVNGRGFGIVDGQFFETLAKAYRLPRRVGAPDIPIPHELETLKEIMGDKFHGRPLWTDRLRIVPSKEPLGTIRKRPH